VSFLIPPGTGKLLTLDTKGKKGVLLDDGVFKDIHNDGEYNADDGGAGGLSGSRDDIYSKTGIVAFRYDPCAPQAFHGQAATPTDKSQCRHEVRLVAQTVDGGNTADAGIHLVYEISENEAADLRTRLRAMKKACSKTTAGVPVGPHPCLEGDGAADFFENEVKPIILDFVGDKNLTGGAIMVTSNTDSGLEWHWHLYGNGIPFVSDVFKEVPNLLETGTDKIASFAGFRADGSYVQDATTEISHPDGAVIKTADIPRITPKSAAGSNIDDIVDGIVAALAAENPRLSVLPDNAAFFKSGILGSRPTRVEGVDCMSCHVQSPALTLIEEDGSDVYGQIRANKPDAWKRMEAVMYKPFEQMKAGHLPATRDLHMQMALRTDYDVINFGFLFGSPSVNRRVQHESEEVAKYINDVLGQ
jgi:hypothetical protein